MDSEPVGRVSTPFDGDWVLVVWWAHRADRALLTLDCDPGRGVFATRSPARPTPACLTACSVLEVRDRELRVGDVDMADGTPVVDLNSSLRDRP